MFQVMVSLFLVSIPYFGLSCQRTHKAILAATVDFQVVFLSGKPTIYKSTWQQSRNTGYVFQRYAVCSLEEKLNILFKASQMADQDV